ncbi:MAG: TolC family protein [Cyclobacteriaceae bacterium]
MRVLLFISLTISLHFAGAQESRSLSLDDCITYALDNNENLEIARLENDIATTHINETLARGLPQVNGSVGVVRNFDVQVNPFPDFLSPVVYRVLEEENLVPVVDREFGNINAGFGTDYSGQAGLNARQLIFDGSYFVGLKAARTVKLLSQREQKRTEVDIVENVSKAYYLVLVTTENLEFLGRNFATIDTLLRETTAMYESGFAEKIDVSRIKIQHNNLLASLKNNTDLLITSLYLLKFQMGMPVETPVSLSGNLSDINLTAVETGSENALENRPEFAVLQTNRDLLDLNIQNYKSQYVPNIYANFNYGWTSGTRTFGDMTNFNNDTWFKYSNLGINLSIPIFDGLSKRSIIQRNKIQILQVDQSIDQFKNNVEREVSTARINVNNAIRNVESQNENVRLAEEVYDVSKIKYQEGLGSNFEVIQANTEFKEAQTNYLNALYEAATAQIELKKALGTLYKN